VCHELWMWWRRERAREEAETLRDLFDRETRSEAPRHVSDDDRKPAERTTPDHGAAKHLALTGGLASRGATIGPTAGPAGTDPPAPAIGPVRNGLEKACTSDDSCFA
jgi:hypothetical protein